MSTAIDEARALTTQLAELLRCERFAMADFVVALADFDRAKRWRELGHASLFYFLHRELGLSTGAAHYRKTAAELVQAYPAIVEPLRDGRLCMTTLVALSHAITPENWRDVLPRFYRLSRREAEAAAAAIAPVSRPPERDVVTSVRLEKAATAVVYLAPPSSSRVVGASAEPFAAVDGAGDAPPLAQAGPSDIAIADAVACTASTAPAPEPAPSCAPALEAAATEQPCTAPPAPARPDAAEPLDAELS
ncbi:MAG TPA: HNH endonuclease, partial [Myxococcales bacterium]